jgi:hypothetical protein
MPINAFKNKNRKTFLLLTAKTKVEITKIKPNANNEYFKISITSPIYDMKSFKI